MKKEMEEMVVEFEEIWGSLEIEEKREVKEKMVKVMRLREDDGGRKKEVREILEREGNKGVLIDEIGRELGISNKNVSSLLCYLKKDGLKLGIRYDGRRYIEKEE